MSHNRKTAPVQKGTRQVPVQTGTTVKQTLETYDSTFSGNSSINKNCLLTGLTCQGKMLSSKWKMYLEHSLMLKQFCPVYHQQYKFCQRATSTRESDKLLARYVMLPQTLYWRKQWSLQAINDLCIKYTVSYVTKGMIKKNMILSVISLTVKNWKYKIKKK